MQSFRLPLRKEIHHFDKYGIVHHGGPRLLEKVAAQVKLGVQRPEDLQRAFDKLKVRWPVKHKFKLAGRNFLLDQTHLEFLRKFCTYVDGGAEDQAYLDLFTPYSQFVTGDITPAYSTLDSEGIQRIQALIPEVKIILVRA